MQILMDLSGLGISGYQAADWLREHHRLDMGLSDHCRIVATLSMADDDATAARLMDALRALIEAAPTMPSPPPVDLPAPADLELESMVLPRDAFFGPTEDIPAREAVGRVAAEQITPYPPGIPVIPSMASADLSIRTVAGQKVNDVAGQVRRWVDETIGDGYSYELSLDTETAQEFYRTPDNRVLDSLSKAMARGFQAQDVGRMGSAGGGPADLLASALNVPVVFFGMGLVEDNWHESDESVRVDILKSGAKTLAFLWEELGRRD